MKKVGYFFSSFLPFIAALFAQFLAMTFLLGISLLFFLFSALGKNDHVFITEKITALLMNTTFSTCIMVLYSIICITFFSLWYYGRCGGTYLPKPSRLFNAPALIAIVILVPGMQVLSSYLVGITAIISPKWLENYQQLIETAGLSNNISPLMLCYSVILAPICEELLFRGVTLRLARRALPFWLANLLQAFLFGLFHMNWIQGIYAFTLGIVLGVLCEKGGSIYYSLLFHILFNFWGTVISQLIPDRLAESSVFGIALFFIMAVSLGCGGALFALGIRKRNIRLEQIGSTASAT